MKRIVHSPFLKLTMLFTAALFLQTALFAQKGKDDKNGVFIPELVFRNPVLVKGKALQNGAEYLFSDVAPGLDAIIKVVRRSGPYTIIYDIDVTGTGWDKAFQPQVGVKGGVPRNSTSWVEFQLTFYEAGTNKKKKVGGFAVTSLDVDGDGQSVKEFVQMEKVDSVKYSAKGSYLKKGKAIVTDLLDNLDLDNLIGTDILTQGPVDNFSNIDTSATQVMSTYYYNNKSSIKFIVGANSGNGLYSARTMSTLSPAKYSTDPGLRLTSMWFKSFNLTEPSALPVRLSTFTAQHQPAGIVLSWTTLQEENFNGFVIERSTDGQNFADAAIIFAQSGNTAQPTVYQYKDKDINTISGVLYYRLRMEDKTGEIAYSSIITVRLTATKEVISLTAYPNPVSTALQVTIPQNWQGKEILLEVYNINGIKLQTKTLHNAATIETLPVESLPKGFYMVKASCENESAQQRILKN